MNAPHTLRLAGCIALLAIPGIVAGTAMALVFYVAAVVALFPPRSAVRR